MTTCILILWKKILFCVYDHVIKRLVVSLTDRSTSHFVNGMSFVASLWRHPFCSIAPLLPYFNHGKNDMTVNYGIKLTMWCKTRRFMIWQAFIGIIFWTQVCLHPHRIVIKNSVPLFSCGRKKNNNKSLLLWPLFQSIFLTFSFPCFSISQFYLYCIVFCISILSKLKETLKERGKKKERGKIVAVTRDGWLWFWEFSPSCG